MVVLICRNIFIKDVWGIYRFNSIILLIFTYHTYNNYLYLFITTRAHSRYDADTIRDAIQQGLGLGSILVRSFILKLIYRYGYYKDIEIFIIIMLIDEQLPYKQRSKQFLVDRLI